MAAGVRSLECDQHGKARAAFVCRHLAGGTGLMFFAAGAPTRDEPWPDAWCEKCESVRIVHGGEWNDDSEAFADIKVICCHCYEAVRARLAGDVGEDGDVDDVDDDCFADFAYRCASCEEIHRGLPVWGADAPPGWAELSARERKRAKLVGDRCEIGDDRYVRVHLEVPIVGTAARFTWAVWGSLSQTSYRSLFLRLGRAKGEAGPYFSWLCTELPVALYPSTALLKAHVYERGKGRRALMVLEPTEHPLAVEQRDGISVARARELATALVELGGGAPVAPPGRGGPRRRS